uniref:MHC class I-like antigen recognition-like domain-containing protein n=1 Tax=Chrysemys picta bellii TaxID=8478 RepID=A0A8C3H7R7_CHRPI
AQVTLGPSPLALSVAVDASRHRPAHFPASVTFRLLHINVFHNASSTDMRGMALLGDLETHSMDCSTCELRPPHNPTAVVWSNILIAPDVMSLLPPCLCFCPLLGPPDARPHPPALPVPDPFVAQGSLVCELHPNGTSRGFYDTGVNGEDFISFDADTSKWVARRGDKLALYARDLFNQDKGTAMTLQFFLRTFVSLLKSFVQHGKESLERQGETGHHSPLAEMQPPLG